MFPKSFLGLISYLYTQWYFVQPIKWVWVLHLHFLTLISHNGKGKDEWILYWTQLDFTYVLLLKTKNEKKEPPRVSAWNINVCTTFHGIWVRGSIHPSILWWFFMYRQQMPRPQFLRPPFAALLVGHQGVPPHKCQVPHCHFNSEPTPIQEAQFHCLDQQSHSFSHYLHRSWCHHWSVLEH